MSKTSEEGFKQLKAMWEQMRMSKRGSKRFKGD